MNLSVTHRLDLDWQVAEPPAPVEERYRVAWDDETSSFGYKCRTQGPDWTGPDNPPAVFRYYPQPIDKMGDFRVNLASPYDWKAAIIDVNGGDAHKWEYLVDPMRATYNQTGWAKQAYLTMSGNRLHGEIVGDFFRFETLKPSDLAKVKGMTIETHPQFVHRFTCVTFDTQNKITKHIESTGTNRGQVYFFVVSYEGIAYIPKRNVVKE